MSKIRRVGAIVGLIFLFSMYLVTLLASIFAGGSPLAQGLFLASTFCTIVIPILIWLAMTVYQWVHRDDPDKKNPGNSEPPESKE